MAETDSDLRFFRRVRTERLIAFSRLVLLAVSLAAASLGSVGPAGTSSVSPAIMAGAFAYAVLAAVIVWRPDGPALPPGAWLHIGDLLLFSVILAIHGSSSTFFLHYLFVLLAAAVRWDARRVLWTGLAALTGFGVIWAVELGPMRPSVLDGPGFSFRVGYLGAATLLFAYFARHQQRLQVDLIRLASWPDPSGDDESTFLRGLLQHVCRVHHARGVVLVREEPGEPWVQIDDCRNGSQASREPAPSADSLVAQSLAGTSFFCDDLSTPASKVVYLSPAGLQRWRGEPVTSLLRSRLKAKRLVSCPLTSQTVRGRLFLLDGQRGNADELLLAEVVTEMLSARLDQRQLARRLRETALLEERGRFSRDLHDGLLQSLTAWGLQIGELARRFEISDKIGAERLHEICRQMSADQRELRTFIGRLHSEPSPEHFDFSLIGRLHDLRDRFFKEWSLRVDMDFSRLHASVPPLLRAEICRMVHEGLANAARHAQTSLARIEVAAANDSVFLSIQDRGSGFPFHGRFDLPSLCAQRRGPASLLERVSALGGELVLDSTPSGSRLDIVLPFTATVGQRSEHAS